MKFNLTNQHFRGRRPDRVIKTGTRVPIPPLHKEHLTAHRWGEIKPSRKCTYDNIIEPFWTMPNNFRIFLDTGFITSHDIPQELWDVVIQKRLFVTKGVLSELQPWLTTPRCNRWLRDYLAAAIAQEQSGVGHDAVSIATIDDFPTALTPVADYYIRLLWLRKYFAIRQFDLFRERFGRDPDIEDELKPICQKTAGARGWRIAQKVLRERNNPSLLVPVDEALVVTALFHGILYCQPTIVLTRDNDVFDQWCKAIYLLDTHYQGMLLAEEYAKNSSRFITMPAPECGALYHGNDNVLISPQFDPSELRTYEVEPIQATCGILSTSDDPLMQSERTFGLVEDMNRLLETKSRTRGRNTDRFGTMNFHAELDPRQLAFGNSGPALVNEEVITTANEAGFPVSITDSELSVFTGERFSEDVFHYVDE